MNSIERVRRVFAGKIPDKVPILEWIINSEIQKKIGRDYFNIPEITYSEFIEKVDLDGVSTKENAVFEPQGEGYFMNEWGVLLKNNVGEESNYFPVKGPINTLNDLRRYNPPDPDVSYRWNNLKDLIKKFKGKKAIIAHSYDAFKVPMELMGLEDLLISFVTNERLVKAVIDMTLEYNFAVIKRALKLGAEIIVTGDDYAFKSSTLMSPDHFRKFILPGLKKVSQLIHDHGGYHVKHTDGNIWPIMDDIIESGIDAINPLEPVADMSLKKVKEVYGDRIVLIGNVDCSYLLSNASVEEVQEEVKECIKIAGPGGKYIMSSSNSIHRSVKAENYMEMIKTTREYGKYPL